MQCKHQQESQILIQLLSSSNRIPELICKYFYDVAFLRQFEKTQGQGFMKKFSSLVQHRIYQQDELIIEQGKPVNNLYLFMYGQVGKHLNKKDKNYEYIDDKTALGEIYFLTRQASKHCFTALQPSLICYLTKENFYKIVKKKNISMSLINELLQYSFFSQFPINFIEQICQRSLTMNCLNHQIIYDINSEPSSWFIILQGEFQVFFHHRKKYYPLTLLSSGDYFGDLEIIQKSQRKYKIQCTTNDSVLLEIKKQNFLQLYSQEPYFQDVIKQNMQNRIISYDQIIKQNILTLDLPFTSRRSRSKIQFKSIHIKIKSNDSSIDPKIQEFFSERDKALQNLLDQKKQKKDVKKTLYQRLREQNPRLLQFLEKMGESKLQSYNKQKQQETIKLHETTKQLPSIQTNPMIESIQSFSPTPLFSCKKDSPIRIRQLTRSRNQNSNSSSVHTLQQTQEILTNMGNKKYFHLLFHKKQQ